MLPATPPSGRQSSDASIIHASAQKQRPHGIHIPTKTERRPRECLGVSEVVKDAEGVALGLPDAVGVSVMVGEPVGETDRVAVEEGLGVKE